MVDPDRIPSWILRVAGASVFLLGFVLLGLVTMLVLGVLDELSGGATLTQNSMVMAFVGFLFGCGAVLVASGYSLVLHVGPLSRTVLVPWQLLIFSGVASTLGLVALIAMVIAEEGRPVGATAKGFGMMLAVTVGFFGSGLAQRRKQRRRLFS